MRPRTAGWALVVLVCASPSLASALEEAIILSTYRSMMGANHLPRARPHAGVDFGERIGAPVLAAADGEVLRVFEYPPGCGVGIVLAHPPFDRWTAYCHLQRALVEPGQRVQRGERIGLVGMSGNAVNIPHVHFELCTYACWSHRDGELRGTQDPLSISAGCFDPQQAYRTDRLVLTFPVECRWWSPARGR